MERETENMQHVFKMQCISLFLKYIKWISRDVFPQVFQTLISTLCNLNRGKSSLRMPFFVISSWAVQWLRRLVAGLPARRPVFDPGSVHVGFVVDKVALGQVFPPSTSVFPCPFHSTGAPLLEKIKKTSSSSSQCCTISLKAAVCP